MFFAKIAFLLFLIVLLIPAGQAADTAERSDVSTLEVLAAARAVWSDLSGFCERNREACETGGRLVSRFGAKARNGASMLGDLLVGGSARDGAADVVASSASP